jgi:hypothetical protein
MWIVARCFILLALLSGAASAQEPPVVATPEGRIADIAVFRSQFLARDRAYSDAARAQAERRLAELERNAAQISQVYFELEIARIVALADNGHTAFFPGPRSRRYNRIEIRFVPFGDQFYVLRAKAANADLLGARLVAIEGHAIEELREAARTLIGGIPAWRDRNAGYFFESPEQMHALGAIARNGPTTYRFEKRQGAIVERRLEPEPANPNRPRANADRWLFPVAMKEERGEWLPALAEARAPWALGDPETPFRWRMAPELRALVIEMRQNNDAEKQPIASFLKDMENALASQQPRHVVLDMRQNGGGDLNTTRDFMQALPSRIPGRMFVLTSPWTFSAGISSIGYLKQAAPARVTIVGEPVGDRMNFFSEGSIVELPNSHAMILNATERHDYASGCRGYSDCHDPVVRHPISVPTLTPDISAPWTIESYLAGHDPAMATLAGLATQ